MGISELSTAEEDHQFVTKLRPVDERVFDHLIGVPVESDSFHTHLGELQLLRCRDMVHCEIQFSLCNPSFRVDAFKLWEFHLWQGEQGTVEMIFMDDKREEGGARRLVSRDDGGFRDGGARIIPQFSHLCLALR